MLKYPITKHQNAGGLLYGGNKTHLQLWSICDIDGKGRGMGTHVSSMFHLVFLVKKPLKKFLMATKILTWYNVDFKWI
jgi:hypothetical protein